MDMRNVTRGLFGQRSRGFAVELWDGSILPPVHGEDTGDRVVIRTPEALLRALGTERGACDAYLDAEIELKGDAVRLIELLASWEGPHMPLAWMLSARVASAGMTVKGALERVQGALGGTLHSPARDRAAVRSHYDAAGELFGVFLDSSKVYSCAYFPNGDESLEHAQRAKLDLVCRKLDVRVHDELLDLGCGWGALLVHASRYYGARAFGVTLSEGQVREARRRCKAEAGYQPEVALQDYRDIRGRSFDKVASIGMMEHVGLRQIDTYFESVRGLMRARGMFLNHAISGRLDNRRVFSWMPRGRDAEFVQRHMIPDSELLPISTIMRAAERAGFEVVDLESLREHYATTLGHWLSRLEKRWDEAVHLVGVREARAWRLHLASSAVLFRLGQIDVYQMLLGTRDARRRCARTPRSRAEWYRGPARRPDA